MSVQVHNQAIVVHHTVDDVHPFEGGDDDGLVVFELRGDRVVAVVEGCSNRAVFHVEGGHPVPCGSCPFEEYSLRVQPAKLV